MPGRPLNKLSATQVTKAKKAGYLSDGGGLYLQISAEGAKSWLFIYQSGTSRTGKPRQREMGLGSLNAITLADAREIAQQKRSMLARGLDPIEEKNRERQERKLAAAKAMTFRACGAAYIESHKSGWKSAKHADQWTATLENYAYPTIGSLPVQSIDTGLVLKIIEPIWLEIPETASRLRGRIAKILDWATVRGYRMGDNPAKWTGHLSELLPSRASVQPVEHHPSLPYAELPAFMAALRAKDSISARALEFTILTGARTGQAMAALLPRIDTGERIWTTLPMSMKGKKGKEPEHRVPLCERALEIIEEMKRCGATTYLFPGAKVGEPLSNAAMSELLKGMKTKDGARWMDPKQNKPAVVHGFRSSFKDWCRERSNFPREVVEAALAHVIGDKTEAAYARGDVLQKRRQLMTAWARYCASTPAPKGEVVQFSPKEGSVISQAAG